MLIDKQNTFAWEQALTATALAPDVIDLLPTPGALGAGAVGGPGANLIRDIGAGEPLYLHVLVATQLASTGKAATLTITLESDDNSGLGTPTEHWSSGSIAEAKLVGGYWAVPGIAIPASAYERYLGVRFTVGTENFTSGKISAWLSNNRYDSRHYQGASKSGVN